MYREVKLLGACYKMHYRKEQAAALVGKTSIGRAMFGIALRKFAS